MDKYLPPVPLLMTGPLSYKMKYLHNEAGKQKSVKEVTL
jgi:hypothetical protein